MEMSFRVNVGKEPRLIENSELSLFAKQYGLDRIAPQRYSQLFVLTLLLLEQMQGIDPHHVIDEIKHLEGLLPSRQTKPATEFRGALLRGLWHKHFFPALPSVMAHNITAHLRGEKLGELVNEVLDPAKNPVVTQEMINELSHRVVTESIEERGEVRKLTGEWIIFAKEGGENYYLCVCPHNSEDEVIVSNLRTACLPEYGFLSRYLS